MTWLKVAFALSAACVSYTYVGYPLILALSLTPSCRRACLLFPDGGPGRTIAQECPGLILPRRRPGKRIGDPQATRADQHHQIL